MESTCAGRGAGDDRSIAPEFAPGDMDVDRRSMTPPGPFGAWRRRLRSPAFRPGSSRIGGNRSAARRDRDCSGRPSGCASAAGRGVADAHDAVRRLGHGVVPALLLLALLAGVATQASAQTLPAVSFASAWHRADEGAGTYDIDVRLNKATATDHTFAYTVRGTATPGSDYTALSGTVTVLAGATTATIPVTIIDDSVGESIETVRALAKITCLFSSR